MIGKWKGKRIEDKYESKKKNKKGQGVQLRRNSKRQNKKCICPGSKRNGLAGKKAAGITQGKFSEEREREREREKKESAKRGQLQGQSQAELRGSFIFSRTARSSKLRLKVRYSGGEAMHQEVSYSSETVGAGRRPGPRDVLREASAFPGWKPWKE